MLNLWIPRKLNNSWATGEQHLLLKFNMLINFALWWLPSYTYVYYIHIYMCTCVHMCIHAYIRTHMNIYIFIYIYIYVYVCVSVCMGPRPRRFTLKGSAGCYYLSIIKKQNIYTSHWWRAATPRCSAFLLLFDHQPAIKHDGGPPPGEPPSC